MKEIRPILRINHDLCDGCGDCVPHCAEKAIYVENGTLKIIAENLCDGIGACLGICPKNALSIEHRLSDAFDMQLVTQHLTQGNPPTQTAEHNKHSAKPEIKERHGNSSTILQNKEYKNTCIPTLADVKCSHEWPIKLALAPVDRGNITGKVAIVADCVAMTVPSFREKYIEDGTRYFLVCPRLENKQLIQQKMQNLLRDNSVESLQIYRMEVPCCCVETLYEQIIPDTHVHVFNTTGTVLKGLKNG